MITALKSIGTAIGNMLSIETERHRQVLALMQKRVPRIHQDTSRIAFERQWVQNAQYYGGNHYFAIVGNQVVPVPRTQHEVRAKVNLIKPAVHRAVAKVLRINPEMGCVPESGSPLDRGLARLSWTVAQHMRGETDYESERLMAYLWACVTGTSFIQVDWDPDRGDIDRFYWQDENDRTVIDPSFLTDEEKQYRDREMLFDDLPPGDAKLYVVPPFQAYPDLVSKGKMEDCRWFCTNQFLPRDLVADAFGVEEKDLATEDASASSQSYEEALALMANGSGQPLGYGSYSTEYRDRVWLTRCWERPMRSNKQRGRFIAVAGGRVLRDVENPNAGDKSKKLHIPFTKVAWSPALGRFWDNALVDDLTNPQYLHNVSRSLDHSYAQLYCKPGLLVPTGCGIQPSKVKSVFGPVYEYQPGMGQPMAFPVPTMPPEAARNAETCKTEIAMLSAQMPVETGKLPGQIRGGQGIEAIQSDSDIALDLTLSSALRVECEVMSMFLAHAKLRYTTERIAKTRGPNGEWIATKFIGSDLVNNVRILGEPGSLFTSDSYRKEVNAAVASGALQPAMNPEHAQMFLKAMRFKDSNELIDDFLMHEERQEAEIREMLQSGGMGIQVMPFEDDRAHMRVLERFFHSDEWKRLNQAQQEVLLAHWQLHDEQSHQKQLRQLELVAATQSTPAARGVASQPAPRQGSPNQ